MWPIIRSPDSKVKNLTVNWHGTGLRQSEPENTTDVGRFFHSKCSCEKTPDAIQSNWSVSQVKKALEGAPQCPAGNATVFTA